MSKLRFLLDNADASHPEIAAWAGAGRRAVGRETRKMNKTSAKDRAGRHLKLAEQERAERAAKRSAQAARRREEAETLKEAAKIRLARRRARKEEEEAGRRRRFIVQIERPPKVTARGGRNLYRRHARFERTVLPQRFGSTGDSRLLSRLVFRIKTRSLGGNGPSRWRRREAARFARYLIRYDALEGTPCESISTNIADAAIDRSSDTFVQHLAGFMVALEEAEIAIDPAGQVYKSIIVPLPYEVELEGRMRIRDALVAPLAKRGVPYIAVLHAPDPGGDQRNYHLHIQVGLREFKHVGPGAFAFAETKNRDLFHPAMLKAWRRFAVSAFNRELASKGSQRRFTLQLSNSTDTHHGRGRTDVERADREKAAEELARREAEREVAERTERLAKQFAATVTRMHDLAAQTNVQVRRYLLEKVRNVATRTKLLDKPVGQRMSLNAGFKQLVLQRQRRALGTAATVSAGNHRSDDIWRTYLSRAATYSRLTEIKTEGALAVISKLRVQNRIGRLSNALLDLQERVRRASTNVAKTLPVHLERLAHRSHLAMETAQARGHRVSLKQSVVARKSLAAQVVLRITNIAPPLQAQMPHRTWTDAPIELANRPIHFPASVQRARTAKLLHAAKIVQSRTEDLT